MLSWLTELKQSTSVDEIKGSVRSSVWALISIWNTWRGTNGPKRCENNVEANYPNILSDKNDQASSQYLDKQKYQYLHVD